MDGKKTSLRYAKDSSFGRKFYDGKKVTFCLLSGRGNHFQTEASPKRKKFATMSFLKENLPVNRGFISYRQDLSPL